MNLPSYSVAAGSEPLRTCRCCLTKECFLAVSAEQYDFGKKKVYLKMLEEVFNIQTLQESLSADQYICKECVTRLQDASSFKQMVIRNEEMYLKCLQNIYENDANRQHSQLKIEEIKPELPPDDFDMDFDENPDDSFDNDDEILANLNCEPYKEAILEQTTKIKSSPQNTSKSKKCKKKTTNCEITEKTIIRVQDTAKLTEHRGNGPILRENSLKLLAHSTASVFQWNKSRYRCFCCKEPFSDIDLLRAHTNCHTLEEIQKKIINQQNRLVKVEVSNLNCKVCNKQLTDLDALKEHLLEHSIIVDEHLLVPFKIESKLKCQICSEPFTLFRLLNIHMNKHYQKHVCYICGAGFSNLVFLNLHRTRSHRPIQCQKCNVTFASRTDKKQHDTEVHGLKYERKNRFPCPFCQERFFQENLKVKHLVDKHGMKKPEFSCQFCSKTFITRSLVNNHVKVVHMKEKNHECDVCHNLFYTKSDVARHRVTHTGKKNYACSLCSNPFASKDSLRRHMKRTHVVH